MHAAPRRPTSPPPLSLPARAASRRRARTALLRRLTVIAVGAWAGAGAGTGGRPASAAEPKPVARSTAELTAQQHFKEGEQRYGARQFQAALDEYQAGFTILPLPGFLVNIGQCYRRMGDLPHARSTFQRFVLAAPDSPLVPEVRELISEIDRQQRSAYLDTPEVLPLSYGSSESEESGRPTHAPGPIVSAEALRASPPAPAASTGALIDMQVEPGPDADSRSGDSARASVHGSEDERSSSSSTSAWSEHRWWLWGGLAAAVIGGSVTAYLALSAPNTVVLHDGTLGSLRR